MRDQEKYCFAYFFFILDGILVTNNFVCVQTYMIPRNISPEIVLTINIHRTLRLVSSFFFDEKVHAAWVLLECDIYSLIETSSNLGDQINLFLRLKQNYD